MAIKYYSSIDLNENELQKAVIHKLGSAPSGPSEGQIYYNSSSGNKSLYVFDGSSWLTVGQNSISTLTVETSIVSGDKLAFSDESETGDINNSITVDNLIGTGLQHVTEAAIANGDYLMFLDGGATGTAKKEALADVATLFAGTGLSASSSVLSVDASQTQITSVGALNAGSITSGFGTIDTGSSTITTTGAISGGTGSTFSSSSSAEPIVHITNTNADATSGELRFNKDSGSGADSDIMGMISFYGTDASENTHQRLAYMDAIVTSSAHSSEAASLRFYVAENDGTNTLGLTIAGQADDNGEVDVTIGAGAGSTTTIAGNLQVNGTTTTVNQTIIESTVSVLVFEGANDDAHETTLKVVEPTADCSFSLPTLTAGNFFLPAIADTATDASAAVTAAEFALLDGGSTVATVAFANGDGLLHNDGGTMKQTNVSSLATLFAGTNISASSSVLSVADGSASTKGVVELATAAEVITGTDAARVVTADTLSAKSVVCDIDVSSLTDANIVTITHSLGTADIVVQVYDKTTEANIMCDIARTTDDFSTPSTSVVSIDFGTAPPNDCRALITSLAGATAGSIAYT